MKRFDEFITSGVNQSSDCTIFADPLLVLLYFQQRRQLFEAQLLVLAVRDAYFDSHLCFFDRDVLLQKLDNVERLRLDIFVGLNRVVRLFDGLLDDCDRVRSICFGVDALVLEFVMKSD